MTPSARAALVKVTSGDPAQDPLVTLGPHLP